MRECGNWTVIPFGLVFLSARLLLRLSIEALLR